MGNSQWELGMDSDNRGGGRTYTRLGSEMVGSTKTLHEFRVMALLRSFLQSLHISTPFMYNTYLNECIYSQKRDPIQRK